MSGIPNLNGLEKLADAAAVLHGMRGGNNLDLLADVASAAVPLAIPNNYTSNSMPSRTRIDGNGTSRTRVQTTRVEPRNKKRKGKLTNAVVVKRQMVNQTGMCTPYTTNCIGSQDLMVLDDVRSKPIQLKLGKAETDHKSIENMLKHIIGKGTVGNSWGGRMQFKMNERHRHYEFFRHRIASRWNETSVGDGFYNELWPVLLPRQKSGITTTLGTKTVSETGFHSFSDGASYIAPLNRADYEDMSWNLNKMKLFPTISTNVNLDPSTIDGVLNLAKPMAGTVPLTYDQFPLKIDDHNGCSALMANNLQSFGVEGATNQIKMIGQTSYKYNMVFNQGKISYDFMNKDISPAVVEIIVYKVKKGVNMESWYNGFLTGVIEPSTIGKQLIENPISKAYVATSLDKIGTDQLNGRMPQEDDVVTNPRYPFLPVLRKQRGVDSSVKEYSRVKFALKSGARRECEIVLGGDIYDPAQVQQGQTPIFAVTQADTVVSTTAPYLETSMQPFGEGYKEPADWPAMDNHSYIVCMSVQGVKMSAQFNNDIYNKATGDIDGSADIPPPILGDVYCGGDVQYYAKYEETLSAAAYKTPYTGNIYINGNQAELEDWIDNDVSPPAPLDIQNSLKPSQILSLGRTVRVPPTVTTIGGQFVDAAGGVSVVNEIAFESAANTSKSSKGV